MNVASAAEPPRVVAMAGIGHPPRFFATLEKLNVEVVQEVAFADHQEYQQPAATAGYRRANAADDGEGRGEVPRLCPA